jgi:glycosyltransferase involved in cell wall biosynthesis
MEKQGKKLRIATMVTGHFTIPQPPGVIYAPIDLALELTKGLTAKGHKVTFFAPEGSHIPSASHVETLGLKPLFQGRKDMIENTDKQERGKIITFWDQYIISRMLQEAQQGKYDIVHIHPADIAHPIAPHFPSVPVVYTLHDPIYTWRKEVFQHFKSPNQYFVSISNSQRQAAPDLPYIETIYNGIDEKIFPFQAEAEDHLLFVGRMHETKGVFDAIAVAKQLKQKLLLVGSKGDQVYWDTKIKPNLDESISYAGFVPRNELYKYYRRAKAFLMPIHWEEPFGLVMAEAMACGTPVIAFRRGAVPEVVIDGKTGFIVDTVEEMTQAVKKIDQIDRSVCRQHVEENFSIERMINNYETTYYKVIKQHQSNK